VEHSPGGAKVHKNKTIAACLYSGAILLALPGALMAAPSDDLKALVDKGQAKQAYELGAKTPEQLGNPDFDYYFGLAAVDAGHAGEAVLALERYLIQFPRNTVARAELARAYFVLGEDDRAREEFQNVLRENPPPAVVSTIERFLDSIRTREARYQSTSSFYLEAGIGSDSNVNAGVSGANINLPVFGSVTVGNAGTRKGDLFSLWGAGGQFSHPISPGMALFGALGVELKRNDNQHAFDLLNAGAAGGLSLLKDKDLYKLSYTLSDISVESDRFRSANGLMADWTHQFDELQSLQTQAQVARYDYTGGNQVRDADYLSGSVTYRRAFIMKWQPVLSLGGSYAQEHNLRNRPDLGRDLYGARIGGSVQPDAKWGFNAGVSYQLSSYNGPDALLATTRSDDYWAVDASAVYLINRNLSARAEMVLSDNQSNISLYRYQRNYVAFKLRYEFK
jgi:tetratricopeptide (TPR) repeat protein